ncbi:saccharopine dehydrogenase [Brevibacillus parabrevis]|uniref:saccharopine dehydrogenase n=1 Tax=Brevibacillus parabrevis TaxID=54914 RepID=UPI001F62138A|nr:saccharopine dehydrogenase [Brevibacillus parabrevis]MDR4999221.1 saccharopine dehydrogenase [Brevibacillus parabrevis]
MAEKKGLIVGGYGTVGSQIARILHEQNHDLQLLLGGRNPGKPLPFASPRVHSLFVDNTAADPLIDAPKDLSLIINAVNDPDDRLLLASARRQIPLVDVTRWTERFSGAIDRLRSVDLRAPIVLASGWMGGTPALFGKMYADGLQEASVDIYALYSLHDKAGPDSTAYMNRMTIPFHVFEGSQTRTVLPMTEPRPVTFPNGFRAKCYRLDTPDHVTLVQDSSVRSANFRIAFDQTWSTSALVFLVRSGVWKLLGQKARQSILYNPGTGAAHHVTVQIEGRDQHGVLTRRQVEITDPQGQTHLTATGAAIQAQRILMEGNNLATAGGIFFPEQLADLREDQTWITRFFEAEGVQIRVRNQV